MTELQGRARALAERESQIAFARVVLFAAMALLAWMSIGREWLSAAWILVPFALFVGLIIVHEKLRVGALETERLSAFFRMGIARLDGTWPGLGDHGSDLAPENHPFASDLDIFGRGSLFELLSSARTAIGRETLAQWLLNGARRDEIAARQEAVSELKEQLPLRERLWLVGSETDRPLHPEALGLWAAGSQVRFSPLERMAAPLLALAGVGTLLLFFMSGEWLPLMAVVMLDTLFGWRLRERMKALRDPIFHASPELSRIGEVLVLSYSSSFASPRLRALFQSGSQNAPTVVRRLIRLLDLLDAMRNQFFAPFGALLLWNAQVAFRIAAWRDQWGRELVAWMENIGEFEALLSLSGFAFEHPAYAQAELTDGSSHFRARDLGHPLLGAEAIGNDVDLDDKNRLWIVSGSNMSGKSTLLRSIGTNAVLAYCGAPVRASSLRLTQMSIGASIRINDSLQEGSSRFYAEVTRIKQIVDLARGDGQLLFLLDEIFNGTNSHDRRIGAEAILRKLVAEGAIGLVTTHDLALARLSETLEGAARNVHFEDHLEDGLMRFDFRLQDGVVTRSNALELMRAVGLEV